MAIGAGPLHPYSRSESISFALGRSGAQLYPTLVDRLDHSSTWLYQKLLGRAQVTARRQEVKYVAETGEL